MDRRNSKVAAALAIWLCAGCFGAIPPAAVDAASELAETTATDAATDSSAAAEVVATADVVDAMAPCAPTTSVAELCNGLDDNCNGVTDEGFLDPLSGSYMSAKACGNCATTCANGGNGSGTCLLGSDGKPHCALQCPTGYFDADGVAANGCECTPTNAIDTPDGSDQNCDGVDGDVASAIFVAKTGSDSNPGTRELPVASINAAIALASKQDKPNLYVAQGSYKGDFLIHNFQNGKAMSLYGGFTVDFGKRDSQKLVTTIVGVPGMDGATVRCDDVQGGSGSPFSVLDGFTIIGPPLTDPGASSYALWTTNCGDHFEVSHCTIIAGNGVDGAPGVAGDPGASGADGAGCVYGQYFTSSDQWIPATAGDGMGGNGGQGGQSGGASFAAFLWVFYSNYGVPNLHDNVFIGGLGGNGGNGGAGGSGGRGGGGCGGPAILIGITGAGSVDLSVADTYTTQNDLKGLGKAGKGGPGGQAGGKFGLGGADGFVVPVQWFY